MWNKNLRIKSEYGKIFIEGENVGNRKSIRAAVRAKQNFWLMLSLFYF